MPTRENLIITIAKVCHEANRAYCETLLDFTATWELAPESRREWYIRGVKLHLEHPGASPSAAHEEWLKGKLAAGWVLGEKKDPDAKPPTHPSIKPFNELPLEIQVKDFLFTAIVRGMAAGLKL